MGITATGANLVIEIGFPLAVPPFTGESRRGERDQDIRTRAKVAKRDARQQPFDRCGAIPVFRMKDDHRCVAGCQIRLQRVGQAIAVGIICVPRAVTPWN
jgi:hypothetical protein